MLSRLCVFTLVESGGKDWPLVSTQLCLVVSTQLCLAPAKSLRNHSPGARAGFAHVLTIARSANRSSGSRASLNHFSLLVRIQSRKKVEGFAAMYRAQEPEFVGANFTWSQPCRVRWMLENRAELIYGYCFQLRHIIVAALTNQPYRHLPQRVNSI